MRSRVQGFKVQVRVFRVDAIQGSGVWGFSGPEFRAKRFRVKGLSIQSIWSPEKYGDDKGIGGVPFEGSVGIVGHMKSSFIGGI